VYVEGLRASGIAGELKSSVALSRLSSTLIYPERESNSRGVFIRRHVCDDNDDAAAYRFLRIAHSRREKRTSGPAVDVRT